MSAPLVSVVLVTRNGMDTLPEVVDAVKAQQAPFPFEIVAVDSSSTDGSEAFLRTSVDRFASIQPEDFDHGLTRNLGVQYARGELVALLVQDAMPASDRWLEALTAPLFADATLAGAFARQQPRPDARALTRFYAAMGPAAGGEPRVESLAPGELETLAPLERVRRCAFDNVCSCIRRSAWEERPFVETMMAEDLEWSRDALLAGLRIAYVPEAVVWHSHERSACYELDRTRMLHARLSELFGVRTIPTARHLVRAVASCLVLHTRLAFRDRPSPPSLARALALAFAWPLGQYLGGRSPGRCAAAAEGSSRAI